jgi:small subunit ribosomal protein S18
MAKKSISKKKKDKNLGKDLKCPFGKSEHIDYKDVYRLKKFITTRGRILPRSRTGVCARHQRELAREIKRARYLALLPFSNYS